jgi:hypothetical protein
MSASIGVDLGLVRNSTAFVAAYLTPTDQIRIGEIDELKPSRGKPLRLGDVVAKACAFAARHGARVMHCDHHALQPAREHLPDGFELRPADSSSAARLDRFVRVRSLFNEGRIRIPGCYSRLATQLQDVIAKPQPGGGTQIILRSRGMAHSDLAAAFVLAVAGLVSLVDADLTIGFPRHTGRGWDSTPGRRGW